MFNHNPTLVFDWRKGDRIGRVCKADAELATNPSPKRTKELNRLIERVTKKLREAEKLLDNYDSVLTEDEAVEKGYALGYPLGWRRTNEAGEEDFKWPNFQFHLRRQVIDEWWVFAGWMDSIKTGDYIGEIIVKDTDQYVAEYRGDPLGSFLTFLDAEQVIHEMYILGYGQYCGPSNNGTLSLVK